MNGTASTITPQEEQLSAPAKTHSAKAYAAESTSSGLAPILGTLEPRSASSVCSIPGTNDCSIIPMSTASLPLAASHQITPAGFPPAALPVNLMWSHDLVSVP